jgi:hypothetical protein
MAALGMNFDPQAVPPRGVFASVVEAALEYHARGYAPVPIPPREKGPKLGNWQTLKATPERIRQLFRPNSNVGCNLGAISGGLVDVDLDCSEAREFADAILPETESVFGRASNPASHRLYTVAGPLGTKRFVDPIGGGTIVELRADGGCQTVFPPSVHPSGEFVEWEEYGEPEPVDGDELAAAVARLAVRVLVMRYGDRPRAETIEGWLAALATAPDRAREKAREWLGIGAAAEPEDAPSAREAPTQRQTAQSSPATARPAGASHEIGARERAYAERALADECAKVAGTGKGGRNTALNTAALKVGHFVGAGWISRATCEAALQEAAEACGHTKDKGRRQTLASIKSGLDKGVSEPHAPLHDRGPAEFLDPQPKAKAEARATIVVDGETFDAETGERIERDGELAAKGAPAPSQDPLAGVVFDGDDAAIEPPRMLVKRLAPAEGICFIGGQSGAGKTFVAVDLAVSLASGEPFFGHKVAERVGVVILAAEGSGTIGMRVSVARNEKAFGEILPIAWLGSVPDLSSPKELPRLVTRLQAIGERFRATHGVRLGAVIIDTVAAAANLKDENDNAEAARAIRQMNALSRALGAVVMPVHHYGKGQETGLRGASAWRAGADTVISVLAERNEITGHVAGRKIALAKSRYGEEGPIAAFELRFVKTGEDEDGEDVGACVVEPSAAAPGAAETGKASRPSRAAAAYLAAFQTVLLNAGKKLRPFGAEGSEVAAVDREAVRVEFYHAWPADGDTEAKRAASKRKTFNRAEGELIERKLICAREIDLRNFVWAVTRQANAEP